MSECILPFLWMKGESPEIIIDEIKRINECGIDALCIESRPHPDFLGEGWWKDMDIIVEEVKKRNMKIWLLDDSHFPTGYANGLLKEKYPERRKKYINYNMADIWGENDEMTLDIRAMCRAKRSWRTSLSKEDSLEEEKNTLKAVVAYLLDEGSFVDEKQSIVLTDMVQNGLLTYHFPKGSWRIYVVYETRLGGGNPYYIDVIDKKSVSTLIEAVYEPHYERYKDEFGTTFVGFFSDEPGYGNTSGFAKDERIGIKQMPLPWNHEVEKRLEKIYGDAYREKLPLLWVGSVQHNQVPAFRLSYMNIITDLYKNNFSNQLGKWCEEHHVEYIGHVIEDNNQHSHLGCGPGHYFKAMSGQHMAGIDTIGCQIMPGGNQLNRSNSSVADGEFYQYALAKLGESAAVLDPKKKDRCMCELFGAYGWGLTIKDMKWIVDSLLVRGVNHFVPHAFSMGEYPDPDCPPHFYARGNNPLYPHFQTLMQYTGRMCDVLEKGRIKVQAAVLYHAEQEWLGDFMLMQKAARELAHNQIEYLFVTGEMLENAQIKENGFEINGVFFQCLVIAYAKYIPQNVGDFINNSNLVDVIFINAFPEGVVTNLGVETFVSSKNVSAISLEQLGNKLKNRLELDFVLEKNFKEIVYMHRESEHEKLYFIYNESMIDCYDGYIYLRGIKTPLRYDCKTDKWKKIRYEETDMGIRIKVCMVPYEALVIKDFGEEKVQIEEDINTDLFYTMDISDYWKLGMCRSISYPEFENVGIWEQLKPISKNYPEFSGYISYEKEISLPEDVEYAVISIQKIYDSAKIWINGISLASCLTPPYEYEVIHLLKKGNNKIYIEVATTVQREQAAITKHVFAPVFEALSPTGMYGKIVIRFGRKQEV